MLSACLLVFWGGAAKAAEPRPLAAPAFDEAEALLLADIRVHSADEVADVLERLELLAAGHEGFPSHDPVVMVLHGDEASAFTRDNYATYKDTVDRAARLQAFGLLDVRICERWMMQRGVVVTDLPRFVDTIPDGVTERQRLERAGYVRF